MLLQKDSQQKSHKHYRQTCNITTDITSVYNYTLTNTLYCFDKIAFPSGMKKKMHCFDLLIIT